MKIWNTIMLLGALFLVIIISLIVAGCSAVTSEQVDLSRNPSPNKWPTGKNPSTKHIANEQMVSNPHFEDRSGWWYCLPIGKIHITAIRTESYVTNYAVVHPVFLDENGKPFRLTDTVNVMRTISNVVNQIAIFTNNNSLVQLPPTLLYSNSVISSNSIIGPIGTNGSLTFQAKSLISSNSDLLTITTNPLASTTISSIQTMIVSNQPSQFVMFTTSNTTITTVYTELPRVTTNYNYNVTIYADYMGDSSKVFLLRPQMDWFHDDAASFITDNNGLLSSISTSNTDETGNVVVSLAQTAAQAYTLGCGIPGGANVGGDMGGLLSIMAQHREELESQFQLITNPVELTNALMNIYLKTHKTRHFPQKIDVSFNPFDSIERDAADEALDEGGLKIDYGKDEFAPATSDPNINQNWFKTPKRGGSGIYYRPPMPYTVTMHDIYANRITATVLLPNQSPILQLQLNKAPFVSEISQVSLTNGFVGSYTFSKPSSLLSAVQTPLIILSDITSIFTNYIQMRFNIGQSQNTLEGDEYTLLTQKYATQEAKESAVLLGYSNQIQVLSLKQTLLAMQTNANASTNLNQSQ